MCSAWHGWITWLWRGSLRGHSLCFSCLSPCIDYVPDLVCVSCVVGFGFQCALVVLMRAKRQCVYRLPCRTLGMQSDGLRVSASHRQAGTDMTAFSLVARPFRVQEQASYFTCCIFIRTCVDGTMREKMSTSPGLASNHSFDVIWTLGRPRPWLSNVFCNVFARWSVCSVNCSSRRRVDAKPYKFIGFGDIHGPTPYEFIGFGDIHSAP